MDRIYFDNAATTALDKNVLEAMMPFLTDHFGNPSSIHSFGRETRLAIEKARRLVAEAINANPREIFFTSGGTEATNTAIIGAIHDLGCTRIITSPIEHHATLHTSTFEKEEDHVEVAYVKLLPNGHVDLQDLERLLAGDHQKTLVSLMHANNEIGNLLDVERVGELCHEYGAFFHCDTVQTIGKYPIDVKKMQVHFISCAAHKFHGPKGIGFLYINQDIHIHPLLHGGSQERDMRAGTENLYGIVGLGKALEIALQHQQENQTYVEELKFYLADQLRYNIENIRFNGDWKGKSHYGILNVSFPKNTKTELLTYNLDIAGICVSSGSACQAGANTGSHVVKQVNPDTDQIPIRFSFSPENTKAEIDFLIQTLNTLLKERPVHSQVSV